MSYFSQFYIPMTFLLKQFLSFLPFPGFLLLYLVGAEKNKKNAPLFNSKKRSCLLSICLIRKSVLSKKSAQLFSFWFSFLFTVCRFFSVAVISRCSFFWLAAIWHNRTLPVFLSFALFSRSAKKLQSPKRFFRDSSEKLCRTPRANSNTKFRYSSFLHFFSRAAKQWLVQKESSGTRLRKICWILLAHNYITFLVFLSITLFSRTSKVTEKKITKVIYIDKV